MKKISIVGFGRFGKTLYHLMKDDFKITTYNRSIINTNGLNKNIKIAKDIKEIYENDTVFYSVPISAFENVIKKHKKYFKENHLLIDVLSVKIYPKNVFTKLLKNTKTQVLLTHPMFGPDSSKNGFEGLPIMLDKFRTGNVTYNFWKKYFESKKLRTIEMLAEEHDKIAANSQGMTHFIGRLLEDLKFKETPIDSLGAQKLLQIKEQTCNDSWKLFADLQHYNPYTKSMRTKLGSSYDKIYNKLLPKRINSKLITYGIQGGKGSFNEEAINEYLKKNKITKYKIKYLFTSEKVLRNLHEGNIDYGLFATHNATGGIVNESIQAMARYKFKIVDELEIQIRHFLMKKKNVSILNITAIMAHQQSFRQCKNTLATKYPKLKLETGMGDLVDTARAAYYLFIGKLPTNTAILGPRILSNLYNLEIIDENLQDSKNNLTSFLLVSR